MIVGLNKVIDDEDARADRIKLVAGYMRERMQLRGEHRNWAIKFFLCECLNLINVVGQGRSYNRLEMETSPAVHVSL